MTNTPIACAIAALLAIVPLAAQPAVAAARDDELAQVPRISQGEFRKALHSGRILVLDVRDAESYANGHIPGAVSIPLDDLRKHLRQLKAERRPIVTYCA